MEMLWWIIGIAVIVKLLIIICVYGLRARRLSLIRQIRVVQQQSVVDGPCQPYTQRSPIVNFEETPQPIHSLNPNGSSTYLDMQPPPYVPADVKPPSYEQVTGTNTQPAVAQTPTEQPPAYTQCSAPPSDNMHTTQEAQTLPVYTPTAPPTSIPQMSGGTRLENITSIPANAAVN